MSEACLRSGLLLCGSCFADCISWRGQSASKHLGATPFSSRRTVKRDRLRISSPQSTSMKRARATDDDHKRASPGFGRESKMNLTTSSCPETAGCWHSGRVDVWPSSSPSKDQFSMCLAVANGLHYHDRLSNVSIIIIRLIVVRTAGARDMIRFVADRANSAREPIPEYRLLST